MGTVMPRPLLVSLWDLPPTISCFSCEVKGGRAAQLQNTPSESCRPALLAATPASPLPHAGRAPTGHKDNHLALRGAAVGARGAVGSVESAVAVSSNKSCTACCATR